MSQGIGGDWNVAWWIGTLGRAPVLMISIWKMCFGTWFLCFFFPETVGNFIIPTGELHHFFRGVGQPPTSDWFCLKSWPFICVSQKNQRKSPEEPAEKKQLPPLFLRQSPQSSPGPTGVLVCVFFHCLVVTGTWMDYDFPETVGNFITPTDELHDFSEGLVETTNQFRFRDFGPTPTT